MTEPKDRKRYETGSTNRTKRVSQSERTSIDRRNYVKKSDRPAVATAWSFEPALAMRAMSVVVMPEPVKSDSKVSVLV